MSHIKMIVWMLHLTVENNKYEQMKNKVYYIIATIVFFNISQLYSQVNLQIQPSHTTGVAPLYVFFDATSTMGLVGANDLVNADFNWNFDLNDNDPNGNWETIKGMVVGHVFEEAGTYTVQCIITAPNGSTDTETVTITVSPFSGTTYYVSATGEDANDGLSESAPWQTANYAFSQLSANERILFKRGDTFTNVSYHFQNLSGGKMIVGAYGNGNKPILSGTIDEVKMLQLDLIDDIAFVDLHVIVNAPNVGGANFDIEDSSNVVIIDNELEGSTSRTIYNDNCDGVGIFDTFIHDFGVLATYAGYGTRLSLVGNAINNLVGTPQPEHGIRIQGGEKQFIAHNTLTNLIETKTAIQIRGDGQRYVMIYKNKMDRMLGVNPQNSATLAAISYVTIEGNYIGQNPSYNIPPWENTINGINIEATNIVIRNNVIDGYQNAVFIGHDYNGVVSGLVDVYHNTANWRPVSPQSGTEGRIVRIRDVDNVNVHNNFITVPTIAEGFVIYSQGTNNQISSANNVISTPIDYVVNPLPSSAAHQNDISNYDILSNSLANNAGGSGIPVFYDINNNTRNTIVPDVGAFEYSVLLNIQMYNNISVSVYPNPASSKLIIRTNTSVVTISIFDINGRLLTSKQLSNPQLEYQLNINYLSHGIYFLEVQSGKLKQIQKFIKN
ncbi:T9SS type A sorting domain-containing protein [Yeosuana marina]|uniref:T9SS type A sorting domain-containing protein n=1 Tax=Yeosuana marina TaxID=1565536 RepID=UPI0030EC8FB3